MYGMARVINTVEGTKTKINEFKVNAINLFNATGDWWTKTKNTFIWAILHEMALAQTLMEHLLLGK